MMYCYTKEMYACSYKEVFTILMGFPIEELEKIPVEEMQFMIANMDKSYEYMIDYEKPLGEQKMSSLTKAILANLYRDYLASYSERQKIIEKDKNEMVLVEAEKRRKYPPEDVFKSVKSAVEIEIQEKILPVEVKEKGLWEKIFGKIKNILKKDQ